MSALLTLLSMQFPDWRTDDLTLRQLATSDDERSSEALRILKERAKAGQQRYEPEGFAQRLCVQCDASIPKDGPNMCPECAMKQFPKE